MRIFNNIDIDNFRGLSHLEIKDFGDVNLFLGKNNIGKSTILEAIFLLTGMSNPENPQRINSIRDHLQPSSLETIKYLFHNMNTDNLPTFSADLNNGTHRELVMSVIRQKNINTDSLMSNFSNSFNGIELSFCVRNGETKSYQNIRFVGKDGIENRIDNNYTEKLTGLYLPADMYDQSINNNIANIIKNRKKDSLVNLLREFDNNIYTIEYLPEGIFIGYNNIKGLMPISMLGDGLRRYLCIISAIANEDNNIILLDEIDNGVHYSSYNTLWRNIFVLAKKYDKQLFVTTHSKEVLHSLYDTLNGENSLRDLASIYTIEQTNKGENKSYRFGFGGLEQAIENNIEIRSLM